MEHPQWLSRTDLLIGSERLAKLRKAHVMVVGMGGVGSFAAEFLVRAGVGKLTLIDGDTVEASNRNRQLPALISTENQSKSEIMARRFKDINEEVELHIIKEFINPEMVAHLFEEEKPDYILDAIDTITPKITFLKAAFDQKIPIVSSMGAGGRLDPTKLAVVDISKTYNCPFAFQIRKRLKKVGIRKGIKAVFSSELVIEESLMMTDGSSFKKSAYGTISYLPATFGAVTASVVVRDIIELRQR